MEREGEGQREREAGGEKDGAEKHKKGLEEKQKE